MEPRSASNLTPPRAAIRRLAAARLISYTGGIAAFISLMYEIYGRTGSAAWLAATLLLTFGVAGLVRPIAGWFADRYDRQRIMIASDLLGAACFTGMAFAHAPSILLAVAFAAALAESPFLAASTAAVPNLLGDAERLGWANGLVSIGTNGGILVGPVVGGLLVAWVGPGGVFIGNAVTFVVSAALVWSIRGRFRQDGPTAHEHRGLTAGLSFVSRDRVIRTIVLAWIVAVLGGGLSMVADVPLAKSFHTGSWGYGVMVACWGAGSILGSLAGRWVKERMEPRALVTGALTMAIGTGAIGVSPWFGPVLPAILVAGIGDALMLVADQSILQRRTPDAVRSRVVGAADAGVMLALMVSFGVAGLAVSFVGARGTYLIGGFTGLIATGLLLWLVRWMKRELEPEPAETAGAFAPEAVHAS